MGDILCRQKGSEWGREVYRLAQRLKTGMQCLQGLGCSIGQIGHFLLSTTEPIASEVLSPVNRWVRFRYMCTKAECIQSRVQFGT